MRWAAHAAKIALNELAGADHHFSTMLTVGRHRIEDHAADALWVISQDDQRQPRSVGNPVDVPGVDAQCHSEVGDVGEGHRPDRHAIGLDRGEALGDAVILKRDPAVVEPGPGGKVDQPVDPLVKFELVADEA